MGFYSFVVISPEELPLPEYLVHLDTGRNVFNAAVNDIDTFRKRLADAKVRIVQENRLDDHKPIPTEPEPYPDLFADVLPAGKDS
jgi:hypothetical protein